MKPHYAARVAKAESLLCQGERRHPQGKVETLGQHGLLHRGSPMRLQFGGKRGAQQGGGQVWCSRNPDRRWLARSAVRRPCCRMVMISEEAAAAIRTVYERDGEFSAAMELRRLFPGIADNENACLCARTIAGWLPIPDMQPRPRKAR